jgi:hypothetical protein
MSASNCKDGGYRGAFFARTDFFEISEVSFLEVELNREVDTLLKD